MTLFQQAQCNNLNAVLVEIQTQAENSFLVSEANSKYSGI